MLTLPLLSYPEWLLLGVLVAVLDSAMMFRRFSGGGGENVRQWYLFIASRIKGGVPALVVLSLLGDIVCAPLGLAACIIMAVVDRRRFSNNRPPA